MSVLLLAILIAPLPLMLAMAARELLSTRDVLRIEQPAVSSFKLPRAIRLWT
jgi:hypothetical protein